MTINAVTAGGYSVEDLNWLRAELGIAHLELDPWGSLIVTPATDEHEAVVAELHGQAVRQLSRSGFVRSNSVAWRVPGGSGYVNVADLTVLAPGWKRMGDLHLDPAPLLVVEVGSIATHSVDRSRKLHDYRVGGAGMYLLVDLPRRGSGSDVTFEAHDFVAKRVTMASGVIDLTVAEWTLRMDLTQNATPSP